jgi:hypothetical protein
LLGEPVGDVVVVQLQALGERDEAQPVPVLSHGQAPLPGGARTDTSRQERFGRRTARERRDDEISVGPYEVDARKLVAEPGDDAVADGLQGVRQAAGRVELRDRQIASEWLQPVAFAARTGGKERLVRRYIRAIADEGPRPELIAAQALRLRPVPGHQPGTQPGEDRVQVEELRSPRHSVPQHRGPLVGEGGERLTGRGERHGGLGGRRQQIGAVHLKGGGSGLNPERAGAVAAVEHDDPTGGRALLHGPADPVVGDRRVVYGPGFAASDGQMQLSGLGLDQAVSRVIDQQGVGRLAAGLFRGLRHMTGRGRVGDDGAVLGWQLPYLGEEFGEGRQIAGYGRQSVQF